MADDGRPRWTAAGPTRDTDQPALPPVPSPAAPTQPTHAPAVSRAPPAPLPFIERVVLGFLFGTTLTMAIAHNPDWRHYIDLGSLLPARYVDLLAVLPVSTNTALVFVALSLVTLAILFLARDPVLPLGITTALSLGLATYPYGRIRWHRLVFDVGTTTEPPGLLQWVTVLVPVLLLAALPLLLHIRRLRTHYRDKGVDTVDTVRLSNHLVRQAMIMAGVAVVVSAAIGILLRSGPAIARRTDLLKDNPLIVIVAVAALLILALAVGAGIFRGDRQDEADAPGATGRTKDGSD